MTPSPLPTDSEPWVFAVCHRVEAASGLVVEGHARTSLAEVVTTRARLLELPGPEAYADRLLGGEDEEAELGWLVEALANGETHFFRDEGQFEALRHLLGTLAADAGRPLSLWSAGCASGEEAWSLAITCAELGVEANIVASDVSTRALSAARRGVYGAWSLRRVPEDVLARHFVPSDEGHRIDPKGLPEVRFVQHNLVRDPPPRADAGAFDLVLCRNVLIYFRRPRALTVIEGLAGALAPEGWLVVGAGEVLDARRVPLTPVEVLGRLAWRRIPAGDDARGPQAGPSRPIPLPRPSPTASGAVALARPGPAPAANEPATPPTAPTVAGVAEALAEGRLDEAAARLDAILTGGDTPLEADLLEGHLCLARHDFPAALAAYDRVHERDGLLPEAHYFEALTYRKMGEPALAEVSLRRALFLAPTMWEAALMLSGVYDRLGRHGDARREAIRVVHVLDGGLAEATGVSFREAVKRFLPDAAEAVRLCRRRLDAGDARGTEGA